VSIIYISGRTNPEKEPIVPKSILGTRIRERRRAMGVTQAEMSRRIGISASYLNLIERNKRGIAGPLLRRAAAALELRLDELDDATERRLLESLNEIAVAPDIAALGVEAANAGELIGRYPGWARALAALARSERTATAEIQALSDRLTHDSFLGESVHRMLTRVAAIRSAAEILIEFPDAPADRREQFLAIVNEESRALTDVCEALAAYFDKAGESARTLTPLDEVEALLEAFDNHFETIEADAAALSGLVAEGGPAPRHATARALATERLAGPIDAILAGRPEIRTTRARDRARAVLLDYAAGAILAPMPAFRPRAAELGYDVEALAATFALEGATVCQRLVALAAPGTPRFGYFRANAAGTIIERRGLPRLVAPRYAAACPLWVLYRAQQSPEAVIRQRALFPNGDRFVFVARAHNTGPSGFGKPRHYLTDMLVMTEADAGLTVYAPSAGVPVEEVGPACRICPRHECPQRVDDLMSS
jgi:predicted transcriptional regulator/DNA-binding XRE family transcriptional regulator